VAKPATVTFIDSEARKELRRTDAVPNGFTTLLEVAQAAGVEMIATCGGRGRCRSCRIKILKGDVPPPTIQDNIQLGSDDVQERFRLACQTALVGDCAIMVAPPMVEGGHQILSSAGGNLAADRVSLDSGVDKYVVTAKAPTEEHHQTSDLEEILAALPKDVSLEVPVEVLRKIPALLRARKGELTVTTFNNRIIDVEAGDTAGQKYGMAFDIGTTTIVGCLMDLATGEQMACVGNVNPQAAYGGDLMSRIAYAMHDPQKLTMLRAKVLNAINGFVREACDKAAVSAEQLYKMVIVGNSCMHHVFLGVDVTYLGLAPYAPVLRHPVVIPAGDLPLKAAPNAMVCFLPIVAGFVGADTVACVLATGIYKSEEMRALVDIGTNGEVVMGSKDRLMACSAPAGPALEGAQIRHGMRGAVGAIEKVRIDGDVECDVIGNVPAVGICGSGLIDAVAKMLEAHVIADSGTLRHDELNLVAPGMQRRMTRTAEGKEQFVLVWTDESGKPEDITLTQTDIRQLQLAKGAIYSGILMLQRTMAIRDEDLAELMLCGGFGNYINIQSAVRIRLLPTLPLERITYYGNAAHMGAQMALLSESQRNLATELAQRIEHVALASSPDFQDVFVYALPFAAPADLPDRKVA
jgi:uncharacterized 2Fe-2S/4Fe-4S cluster protein (DUF4445 family)